MPLDSLKHLGCRESKPSLDSHLNHLGSSIADQFSDGSVFAMRACGRLELYFMSICL